MATAQAALVPVCHGCGSDNSTWFCEDCQEYLCDRCKDVHQRFTKTKNDTIIPMSQVQPGSQSKIFPVLCDTHKTKICDLYCQQCELLICSQCLSSNHKTHAFDSVETFVHSKISELDNIEQNCKTKRVSYDSVLQTESKQHTEYLQHLDQMEDDVKDQTDKLAKDLYEIRDEQIRKLAAMKKEEETRHQLRCDSHRSQTSLLNTIQESAQKAKISGNAETMMQTSKELMQSYKSIMDPYALPPRDKLAIDSQESLILKLQKRLKETKVATTAIRTPTVAEQKATIVNLMKNALKKGDTWYLLDCKWYRQWKKHVGFDSWDSFGAGEPMTHPGPIDNAPLLTDDESLSLKNHLIEELDYVLLPEDAWNAMVSLYGIVDGQSPVAREVIEQGTHVKHFKVEIYLIDLKLCKMSNPDNVITKQFSRAATVESVEKEMRKIFKISEDKEVRLWNKYMASTYEHLNKPCHTVQDAGLYTGQTILIEQKKEDGTWQRKV